MNMKLNKQKVWDNKGAWMNIINFEKKHVQEAMEIALENYDNERQHVKELPQVCDIPDLYGFAENGLGVADRKSVV